MIAQNLWNGWNIAENQTIIYFSFISWHSKMVYMPKSVSILDFWKLQMYIFMTNIHEMMSYCLMFKLLYLTSLLGRCIYVNKSVMVWANMTGLQVYIQCVSLLLLFFFFLVSAYKWFWMCAQLPVKIFITIILNGTHQLLFTLNRCMCLKPFWPLVLSELYIFFKVRVIFFGKKNVFVSWFISSFC